MSTPTFTTIHIMTKYKGAANTIALKTITEVSIGIKTLFTEQP